MNGIQKHLRNAFLAGIFGFVPLAVTVFAIFWIDAKTRILTESLFHRSIPVVGILLALALIYVTGVIASSILGKAILKAIDSLIGRLPLIRPLYTAWKQIALTPGGTEGTFSRAVLLLDESHQFQMIGFTSGRTVDAPGRHICVFVPAAPNPMQGRMYFVPVDRIKYVDVSAEEVFKLIVSTGNYVPQAIRESLGTIPAL